jgi:signal transduction histidine kinase
MSIRSKLILIYLSIVATLISIFCVAIFFQGEQYRKTEFKNRLKKEAQTAATIYFSKNEISPEILKLLDKNKLTTLSDEEICIFNNENQIVYESGDDNLAIDFEWIETIKNQKENYWTKNGNEFFGYIFKNNQKQYTIISSAKDNYGKEKQQNLGYSLFIGSILILLVSTIAGWLFVKRMLNPLNSIIRKIDSIKASQLNLRLEIGNGKDEFDQLSIRFNQMLDRIQKSFLAQKAFVSHASHELRTPLTSITGQIQVSLLADDKPEDLKKMISSVLEDVQDLNKLSNSLLDLTYLNADTQNFDLTLVNILDKISKVRNDVLKEYPNAQILVKFEEQDNGIPELMANLYLLYTAFYNLIENGIKYSINKIVNILIINRENEIHIEFNNLSKPINASDLKDIFEPFKRGQNSRNTQGHGVGLSLTKGIFEIHNGSIKVVYSEKEGITFKTILVK